MNFLKTKNKKCGIPTLTRNNNAAKRAIYILKSEKTIGEAGFPYGK